jgi:hypothetical protein
MGGVLAGGAGLYVWRVNRKVIEAFDSQTRQRSPIQSHIPLISGNYVWQILCSLWARLLERLLSRVDAGLLWLVDFSWTITDLPASPDP